MNNTIHFPTKRQSTRPPFGRTQGNSTGEFVLTLPDELEPSIYQYESGIERKVAACLNARGDLKHLWDQAEPIKYQCPDGRLKSHTPDWVSEYDDGSRHLIYVKPEEKIASGHYDEEIELISQALSSDYADALVVVTDASFEPWEATNAERLMEFRRNPDEEADEAVAEFASRLDGLITIGDLIAILQIGGRGFRAIFRAIYDGVLKQIEDGIIDLTTVVEAGDVK